MVRFRPSLMLLPALALVGMGLAACGDDDDDAATTAAPAAETTAASAATTAAPAATTAAATTAAPAATTAAPAATTAAPAATTAAPAAGAVTVTLADTSLGSILADADGKVLYIFTNDSGGQSACDGGCAQAWPPLMTDGEPTAGDGVDAAALGTVTRSDGSTQVTYDGHPLYYFASDAAAGDTNGQGVGGVWWVIQADGTVIES